MPIMAKTDAANRNAIALLMQRIVLVAVPRVRRRDVFDMERRALNATGLAEKVKLVVGDNFEKCGSAGWDGACSKVIGDSAKDFKHGSDGKRIKIAACGFGAADVPTAEHGSFAVVVGMNFAASGTIGL
jgi:hypothetical protein